MPASPPDSPAATTVCARCGSQTGVRESSCTACLATDLASGEWSDLFSPGSTELLAGGGFTVLEEIGRGGMGIVYRAQQRAPQREVALKLLPPSYSASGDGAQRLLMEAAMLAELDHPGILPLYASGVQDGRPWLAMKLASGGTLAGKQAAWQGRWRACAELAAGLADAVQHAHERGLIHRDLKPGNILFDEAGRAYVADFGVAKWRDRESSLTHTNTVLGTPAYMAPEVARADGRAATTASDVYGLGAVLYFLLCGQPPYPQAGTLEVLRRIAEQDPAPPRQRVPEVPGDLQVICLKALARTPAARYAGPGALAADLRRWLAGESIEARPASRGEKVRRWVRRHPLSAGLAAALAVTMAGSGVMLWQVNRDLIAEMREARLLLRAAYSSMGYATREIPPQLEAVGRLDVLDGLFQDIESKLAALDRTVRHPDSAFLVYRAELYAHWSLVLRWRGDFAASLQKNMEAVRLAQAAIQADEPAPHAWTVLSMAHRLLAERLTDDEDFAAGLPELEKARAAVRAGREQFPLNLPLRMEEAQVALQWCDSRWSEGNYAAMKEAVREAAALWPALREAVQARGVEPSLVQQYLRGSADPYYYAGVLAEETKDHAAAVAAYHALLSDREARLVEFPGVGDRMFEVALASGRLARSLSNSKAPREEVALHLARADELTTALVNEVDSQNQKWRAEWAAAAMARRMVEDEETSLIECLRRLEPVKDSPRSYIQALLLKARMGMAKLASTQEAKETRWQECLAQAARFAGSQPPRWENFQEYATILKSAGEALGEDATKSEARSLEGIAAARQAAAVPGASPWWAAVEASCHRRLADLLRTDRHWEARDANRTALGLRAGILRGPSLSARQDIIDAVEGTGTALLDIGQPTADDARLVLQQLTELAPAALTGGKSLKWREKWKTLALKAGALLPPDECATRIDALSRALYPDDAPTRLPRLATTLPAEGGTGQ